MWGGEILWKKNNFFISCSTFWSLLGQWIFLTDHSLMVRNNINSTVYLILENDRTWYLYLTKWIALLSCKSNLVLLSKLIVILDQSLILYWEIFIVWFHKYTMAFIHIFLLFKQEKQYFCTCSLFLHIKSML